MKKIAITQSNYIPWKGYFDLINEVDIFVLYDDVQFTRRDWRNRNVIKTAEGLKWLTIPVKMKGKYLQKIDETIVSDSNWGAKHWRTIKQFYQSAKFFNLYCDIFENFYRTTNEPNLSFINYELIKVICKLLNINTEIRWSSEFSHCEGKTERLIGICKSLDATTYISGPAAKNYFDCNFALRSGINVKWIDYSSYPVYQQLFPPFEHQVSVLDLLFNEGPQAKKFMKSFH